MRLGIGIPFLVGGVTLMVQTRAGSRRESTPKSSQLAALEQSAARIAVGKLSVLVLGETGVGKERFAERIHEMSPRRAAAVRPHQLRRDQRADPRGRDVRQRGHATSPA